MSTLDLSPRISRPDDFYETLINAHSGLGDDESMKLNAKLVLILANQVGDLGILEQAIELARDRSTDASNKRIAA